MPCNVKTALDVSMAMRLYWVMDGSGFGCSQPQFWHAMPWGRPLQHLAGPGMVGCSLLSGPDDPDAAQTQRRSPSPHPEDGVQGAELGGLGSGPAPARQPDVVDRGCSAGMLADHGAKRSGLPSYFRPSQIFSRTAAEPPAWR